ncbi:MAG: HAMP domain-containing histidine kinase, partial [Bacteroidia bacterium]|nr:HAMP domain-containing histidine kinase [Bacteroidia bacterium]
MSIFDFYNKKHRWKWLLFFTFVAIVSGSVWYTNTIVSKIAREEKKNITLWADAIHRKAELVNYTEKFFIRIQEEERKRVEILALATKRFVEAESNEELTFYSTLIQNNTTIPVIQTNKKREIIGTRNVDFDADTVPVLQGKLLQEFSVYDPVKVDFLGDVNYLYYKESKLYSELRKYLDELVMDFFSETVINSASVPVIITDSLMQHIIAHGNIPLNESNDSAYMQKLLNDMRTQRNPIELELEQSKNYILYKDSLILTQLQFFPVIQLTIIALFILISYLIFSTSRRSEQNQVWAGMAKETAHQLGTPLSSIMAWSELLRIKGETEVATELDKDILRLETIAQRFSKIGSEPTLQEENIIATIYEAIDYLRERTPSRVTYHINIPENQHIIVPLNKPLFEWVIENLCK